MNGLDVLIQFGSAIALFAFFYMLFFTVIGKYKDITLSDGQRVFMALSAILVVVVSAQLMSYVYTNFYEPRKEYEDKVDSNSSRIVIIESGLIPALRNDISSISNKYDRLNNEVTNNADGLTVIEDTDIPQIELKNEEQDDRLELLYSDLFPTTENEKLSIMFVQNSFDVIGSHLEGDKLTQLDEYFSRETILKVEKIIKEIKPSYKSIDNSLFRPISVSSEYLKDRSSEKLDVWRIRILYNFSFDAIFNCTGYPPDEEDRITLVDSWVVTKVALNKEQTRFEIISIDQFQIVPSNVICDNYR